MKKKIIQRTEIIVFLKLMIYYVIKMIMKLE